MGYCDYHGQRSGLFLTLDLPLVRNNFKPPPTVLWGEVVISVPALTPFDLTVNWNLEPAFDTNEVWYGWFSVGSSAVLKDDVGKLDFNLYKVAPVAPVLDQFIYLPCVEKK